MGLNEKKHDSMRDNHETKYIKIQICLLKPNGDSLDILKLFYTHFRNLGENFVFSIRYDWHWEYDWSAGFEKKVQ